MVPSSPNVSFTLSLKFNSFADLSNVIDAIPDAPWNSTSSLNVETPDALISSNSLCPSTLRFAFIATFELNVDVAFIVLW